MLRRIRWGVILACLGCAGSAMAAERPQRIVSLNMCTDQLVLALADPQQIAALSRFAGDARLSHAAEAAAPYAHLPAAAEAVLPYDPDLIVAGQFTNRAAKDMLRTLGYDIEEVDFVRSLDEARAAIRQVADLVGYPERGEGLVARIDAALARHGREDNSLSAVLLQRRGYATGSASLTGDLMRALGLRLASDGLVGERGGFASLETLVLSEPELLILSTLDPVADDQGSALLSHPALQGRFPPEQRMALPERFTVCPGPGLIEAIETLAEARDRALADRPDG